MKVDSHRLELWKTRTKDNMALLQGPRQVGLMLAVPAIFVLGLSSRPRAHEEDRPQPGKVMQAVRVNPTPPRIDGVLDDKVWQVAPIATGFTQVEPEEGEPPTEKTTVQVAYDDQAIYFGIMCYDREPDKIVSRLARRDQWVETDQIGVNLDPHHDHQTGYVFKVGPSGWMSDAILFNDGRRDYSWDGVWEAKTSIHDEGWSVEYKIPYHVLRFTAKKEYTWGITAVRRISRKREQTRWVFKTSKEAGWVSKFGHLEG